MPDGRLLALLHLCDSLFPTGGFSHSDGLEAATASGTISTAADLSEWMDVCLDEVLARSEGPAVRIAWEAFSEGDLDRVIEIDADVHALRPSSTARQASRALGRRLLKTWHHVHPHPDRPLEPLLASSFERHQLATLPVAFGIVCASETIAVHAAVEGFFYTRLAATVSCAMRLMAIGQHEAHAMLASALARVPAVVDRLIECPDRPEAFAPAFDIAVMRQQYLASRLFLS
jgi:urease accessory protein